METATSRDGTSVAFDRYGDGPAVVLVGGAFQHRAIDQPTTRLAEVLAERFTVIHYDRRGRGDSDDTLPYAVEREAEDLEALIDDAGGHAHVFGMSSGGALALEAAARGASIDRLAVYEVPYNPAEDARARTVAYRDQLATLLDDGRHGDAAALALTHFGAPAEAIAGMRAAPFWPMFEAVAPTLAYDDAIMGDGSPPYERLASADVPTLVMAGGASPAWMQDTARLLVERLPDAQHHLLDDQTHDVAPEVLAPVLAEYFAER
jgi:pimeloyl-ACP methyl ester carboxylesterase